LSYELTATKVTSSSLDFIPVFEKGTILRKLTENYMVYSTKDLPFFATYTTVYELTPTSMGMELASSQVKQYFLFHRTESSMESEY
jgi:hypothetical protein